MGAIKLIVCAAVIVSMRGPEAHALSLQVPAFCLNTMTLLKPMKAIAPFTVEQEAECQAGFSKLDYVHIAPLKPLFDALW